MDKNYSPLRYPGGKGKFSNTVKDIIEQNSLYDSIYIEPFAGGAGVALSLLLSQYVKEIVLNDINYQLFSFWKTLIYQPDYLLRKVQDADLTITEWEKQRNIFRNPLQYEQKKVGFAFFYLNRTNRSGILNAGVIGGLEQKGKYKMGARFNKTTLRRRIQTIIDYKSKIHLYNLDTIDFLRNFKTDKKKQYFAYFDPPYFNKGQDLYTNFYTYNDHEELRNTINSQVNYKWILTYDDAPEIRNLYNQYNIIPFNLLYCAHKIRMGKELLIASKALNI